MRLQGKVALVTGAGSGIGHAVSELFVREGATVFASDIASPATPYTDGIEIIPLDVTSEEQWKAAIAATVAKFGALHVLVNSAGIGLGKTVEEIELEEWRKVHAIDLDGVFLGCKHGVAEIKKHTATLGGVSNAVIEEHLSSAGVDLSRHLAARREKATNPADVRGGSPRTVSGNGKLAASTFSWNLGGRALDCECAARRQLPDLDWLAADDDCPAALRAARIRRDRERHFVIAGAAPRIPRYANPFRAG